MARPKGYDADSFIHFVERRSENNPWLKEQNDKRKMPDKDAYEIDFEYIEQLNLNKVGNEIPSTNNVWNVERYMSYFWKQIMDAECIFVWHHLWEYCNWDEGVDICYPKIKELSERTGLSKPTLLSKIKKLEENNFLVQIHRLNKKDGNRETSPIFKLRRTIPLLSKEQVAQLTPFMQKKHAEYMEKFASDRQLTMFHRHTGSDTIENLIHSSGDKMISKKRRQKIKEMIQSEENESYIVSHLPEHMKHTIKYSEEFKEGLIEKGISKPFADTVFDDVMVVYDSKTLQVHIIYPSETVKEFAKTCISEYQYEKLLSTLIDMYEDVYSVESFTKEEYIITILKSK